MQSGFQRTGWHLVCTPIDHSVFGGLGAGSPPERRTTVVLAGLILMGGVHIYARPGFSSFFDFTIWQFSKQDSSSSSSEESKDSYLKEKEVPQMEIPIYDLPKEKESSDKESQESQES